MTTKQRIKTYFKTLTIWGKLLYVVIGLMYVTAFWNPDNIAMASVAALLHYMYTTDPNYCPRAKEIFAIPEESL